MKEWKIRVIELEQKAISKYGKKRYIRMVSLLSGKSIETVKRLFSLDVSPTLSMYCDILNIIDS